MYAAKMMAVMLPPELQQITGHYTRLMHKIVKIRRNKPTRRRQEEQGKRLKQKKKKKKNKKKTTQPTRRQRRYQNSMRDAIEEEAKDMDIFLRRSGRQNNHTQDRWYLHHCIRRHKQREKEAKKAKGENFALWGIVLDEDL